MSFEATRLHDPDNERRGSCARNLPISNSYKTEATRLHDPDNERRGSCARNLPISNSYKTEAFIAFTFSLSFSCKIKYAFLHEGLKLTARHLCH